MNCKKIILFFIYILYFYFAIADGKKTIYVEEIDILPGISQNFKRDISQQSDFASDSSSNGNKSDSFKFETTPFGSTNIDSDESSSQSYATRSAINSSESWEYDPVTNIRSAIRKSLESELVRSQKYKVIEGAKSEDESKDITKSDYILSCKIIDYVDSVVGKRISETNKIRSSRRIFKLSIVANIKNTKDKSILTSFPTSINQNDLTINASELQASETIVDKFMSRICEIISKKIVIGVNNTIFPPKIVKIEKNGDIYLNVGTDHGVSIGDRFDICTQAEAIRDPETGAILGFAGNKKGTVIITAIYSPTLSMAKIESSNGSTIGIIGDILKPADDNSSPKESESVKDNSHNSDNDYTQSLTGMNQDEMEAYNSIKALRIQAADSESILCQAKQLVLQGERKIRDGRQMEYRQDYVAGRGTTMQRYVDCSATREEGRIKREEGERMVAKAALMREKIQSLYKEIKTKCYTVAITSKGRELVGIPLIFDGNRLVILVNDKVYKINASVLDPQSLELLKKYRE